MRVHFLSRGPIDQISGGYLYNRYLIEHLEGAGLDVRYHPGWNGLAETPRDEVVVVDSLVVPELAHRLLAVRARLVLLLHVVPDAQGLGPGGGDLLARLYERARVVVTGDSTLTALRDLLVDRGIDAVKIEPGVPEHWREKDRYAPRARRLLGVANYLPGKGIGRLIAALAPLRDLPWTLTVRGNTDFDREHYRSLQRSVVERGLSDRIDLLGPVSHDAVNDEMIDSDLLVHFSEHESFSMVTAEAIASGLPVLSYPTGNAEAFGRSGLVQHVDSPGEQRALWDLIEDSSDYARLRRAGPRRLRTWSDVGTEFLGWLEG